MVDQEPLPWWTGGNISLLGDAAHPMVPRGSNGAGQAILDAAALAEALTTARSPADALTTYENQRRPVTTKILHTNRTNPPDAILREIYLRTGDQPFDRIDNVISQTEMREISGTHKASTGSAQAAARLE